MKKYLFSFLLMIIFLASFLTNLQAQQYNPAEQVLAQDGKIYVVVAVLGTILLGFLGYVVFLDKKITKIEEQIKKEVRD